MTNAARRLQPTAQLRLVPMPDDTTRNSDTLAPPTDREAPTNPAASERPAIAPPAPLPDDDELAATALASRKPPAWWESSYIGQSLSKFSAEARKVAEDAQALREGRDAQHAEQMSALHHLRADNELIRGEIVSFRKAVHEKDADHDKQLEQLRAQVAQLSQRVDEQERDLAATKQILHQIDTTLKSRDAAPPPTPA